MLNRDVTTGKIQVLPLQWWAESAHPGCNRVNVSQNLGATVVAPVAPVDTSLLYLHRQLQLILGLLQNILIHILKLYNQAYVKHSAQCGSAPVLLYLPPGVLSYPRPFVPLHFDEFFGRGQKNHTLAQCYPRTHGYFGWVRGDGTGDCFSEWEKSGAKPHIIMFAHMYFGLYWFLFIRLLIMNALNHLHGIFNAVRYIVSFYQIVHSEQFK